MKVELYHELIKLHRDSLDATSTEEKRQEARENFEQMFHATTPAMQVIIQDAIADAPSTSASMLWTYRAAATDYQDTGSLVSAAFTFFNVATTRLTNPAPEINNESSQNANNF